jgi:protein-tyrosine phosphatase
VLRKLADEAGLAKVISVASAGTHGYHAGEAPDARAMAHARRRGYDLSRQRARRFSPEDFHTFDLILAMDREHHAILAKLAPPAGAQKLRMMLEFARRPGGDEVPDPYYGGPDGFELVLDLIEDAAAGLLDHLKAELAR